MPLAVALLCHPAGAYGCLVSALAALVYAWHTRRFVPAFTAAATALLTLLAFLQVPPNPIGVALLALGAGALQAEFLLPTYGAALLAGLATTGVGSWLLLASLSTATGSLSSLPRGALAALGTVALLAAVVRGIRVRTLGAH